MKIANWNLNHINPSEDSRLTAIRKHFAEVKADIWVLTETHELVAPGKDFSSVMSGEPDWDAKQGEHWSAIWSRHPIMHLPSFVSDPARCTAARIDHPDIGEIVVYATVLPWGGSKWRDIGSADGAAFKAALDLYVSDWQRIRTAFPQALIVIAGDFNQDLAPYHYYGSKKQRALLEAALTSVGLVPLTTELNDSVDDNAAERHACIDHICISESPRPFIGETTRWPAKGKPDCRLSDHSYVVVELLRQSADFTDSQFEAIKSNPLNASLCGSRTASGGFSDIKFHEELMAGVDDTPLRLITAQKLVTRGELSIKDAEEVFRVKFPPC
jgi:endonuclease/exonuclease/phosphatase family metal-dependent hydrolase